MWQTVVMRRFAIALSVAASLIGVNVQADSLSPEESRHYFLLDVRGNGFAVGGANKNAGTRWTTAASDDSFLAVEATGLRAIGIDVVGRNGARLEGTVLVSSALHVVTDRQSQSIVDSWRMLAILDTNRDGRLDPR